MKRRVHQVGTARGKTLPVDAYIQPRSEEAAILDLAGQGTVANEGRSGQAGGQRRRIRTGIRLHIRLDCVDLRWHPNAGDGDDILQGRVVVLGKGRREKRI